MKRIATKEVSYCDECPFCSDEKRPYCSKLGRGVYKTQYETSIAIPDECPLPLYNDAPNQTHMTKKCPYKDAPCIEDDCMAWQELHGGYDEDTREPYTTMGCRLIEYCR